MAGQVPAAGNGFVVWIEGLPSSGKTTVSRALAERIRAAGRRVEILDGDEVRHMFSPELGYTRKDREFHARRVSYVARMLARNDVAVLVAMITPYETSRQAARSGVGERYVEVWLNCPVEVCRTRDPKGLYERSRTGGMPKLTGVDDPFEEPLAPDLVVDTAHLTAAQATEKIYQYLADQKFVPPP